MLIANARMYAVNASVAAAWRSLLEWVIARAGVECEVIDYPAPQPLPALWARPDLGCVFMCGYPIASARSPPRVLAAPIPDPVRYGGAPVYFTDIVAHADSPLRHLPDIFGRRFAFTTEDSQSGYQAPRRLLAPDALARGGKLFESTIGPLVTPRRVVEAVLHGEADAGPLDSYFHDLLRHHEPALAAQLRGIACGRQRQRTGTGPRRLAVARIRRSQCGIVCGVAQRCDGHGHSGIPADRMSSLDIYPSRRRLN